MKNQVYIVAAKRSAIGSFNGSLSSLTAPAIAAEVIKDILAQTQVPPADITEVICGIVLPAGIGQGPARQAAMMAGIPETVPAYALNFVCGSGMKAVSNAATAIANGQGDLFIAGGMENMSMSPYFVAGARQGLRLGHQEFLDHLIHDALTDAFGKMHMGITAENIAEKYSISREAQDAFAMQSQEKSIAAVDGGAFKDEIVPITIKGRKEDTLVDTDEYPNRKTSLEKLAALRPAFKKDGSVTAGNSSGINDGAAFLMLASAEALKRYNLTPMAEIKAFGQGGVDPSLMGMGPIPAIKNALDASGNTLSDMEILELNEAFAAQSLGVVKVLASEYGMSEEAILKRTNLNGGAISLGHPVGVSGARIIVTLLHLMQKRDFKLGLASLCIGGGMGIAAILQR